LAGSRQSTEQAAPQSSNSAKTPGGDVDRGRKVFMKDGCYQCHGTEAQGGGYTGPRLAPPAAPLAVLTSQVRRPASEMPPFTKAVLSDQELMDIYAFLQSIPAPPAVEAIPILSSSK
jgi:mono/diheme cytochrome c family protein